MSRKLYISASIMVFVVAILWWLQYKQDKEYMDSLLLHQPIEFKSDRCHSFMGKRIKNKKGSNR